MFARSRSARLTPAAVLSYAGDGDDLLQLQDAYNLFISSCEPRYKKDVLTLLGGVFGVQLDQSLALRSKDGDLTPAVESNAHVFNALLGLGLGVPTLVAGLETLTQLCAVNALSFPHRTKDLWKSIAKTPMSGVRVPRLLALPSLVGSLHFEHTKRYGRMKGLLQVALSRVERTNEKLNAEGEDTGGLAVASMAQTALEAIQSHEGSTDELGTAVKEQLRSGKKLYQALTGITDEKQRTEVTNAVDTFVGLSSAVLLLLLAVTNHSTQIRDLQKYFRTIHGAVVATGATAKPAASSSSSSSGSAGSAGSAGSGTGTGTSGGGRHVADSMGHLPEVGGREHRVGTAAIMGGGRTLMHMAGGHSGRTGFAVAADTLAVGMLAGDTRVLALLDALDVDLSHEDRRAVSNIYERVALGMTGHNTVRDEVHATLGGRAVRALERANLLDPVDGGSSVDDGGSSVDDGASSMDDGDVKALYDGGEPAMGAPSPGGRSLGAAWSAESLRRAAALASPFS
jgi:hypothetical protein